jgi:phosphoribosylformylglycinamidine cyclo-ligase
MSRYGELGVDVRKRGVEAFKPSIHSLYPEAFCTVQPDPDNPGWGLVGHADSAGSKPILSYICWRETGDPGWFGGLARDVVAMNLDDIICVAARPILFLDNVSLNPMNIDRLALLQALSDGFRDCFEGLRGLGITISFSGGETADLPDQVRTLDVSGFILGRVRLEEAVTGEMIRPGDLIVGLRSGGQARYEEEMNSGIMCNGLTLARCSLLSPEYPERYPEVSHSRGRYTGRYRIEDHLDELGMTMGEALLSPTRIFAPIAMEALSRLRVSIHGLVHNTGGGLTKCLRLGRGIRYVKDMLPEPDPIFTLIQREAEIDPREMYMDFNMGVGFELIVQPEDAEEVIGISERFGVEAQVIGHCEEGGAENTLVIESRLGKFHYQ